MSPRKRVAIVDPAEISRNVRSFVADVWGYDVFPVATARQAALLVRRERINVIVAVLPNASDWRSLQRARRLSEDVNVLSLDPRAGYGASCAEVSLSAKCPAAELRESLKVLARRKRGPKMVVTVERSTENATRPAPTRGRRRRKYTDFRMYMRAYYQRNREKIRAQFRDHYEKNKEQRRAYMRDYYHTVTKPNRATKKPPERDHSQFGNSVKDFSCNTSNSC